MESTVNDKAMVELTENVHNDLKAIAADNSQLVSDSGTVLKLPIPSQDPNDPLNFTWWEKTAIMSLSVVGGLGAILDTFIELYGQEGVSAEKVAWLSTFPSLFVGIGNFILLPLGLVYGRRLATIISIIILLGSTLGCALSENWKQHLVLRIIQGFASGATESLLPLMLSEITCLNLASSYEAAALGWRWYYWVFVITVAAGLVLVVLACFETKYHRRAMRVSGRVIITDNFGVTQVMSDAEAQSYLASTMRDELDSNAISEHLTTKKSYLEMLSPISTVAGNAFRIVFMTWFHILEAFSSPGILYATLVTSVVLGSSVGISLTYNTILEYNYDWPAKNIGLINLGGVFGGVGGMVYAGYFGDWFIVQVAKRSRAIASLLLYGFTAEGDATWGGPFMGWTLFQVVFVSVLIQSTSFASEAWEKNPGAALVAVVGTKNIISFGLSYGLSTMVAKYSYPTAMGILAGVVGGIFLLGIPVYIFNPKVSFPQTGNRPNGKLKANPSKYSGVDGNNIATVVN
ncbi:hypothetical protein PISL3812_09068 [Talaromyces islandicus]|uniref:Major facilitator superfamily (MFS) profile domain-containing protein n=1 Tax=Talaromyces islandicus TaxID=28573 RepID=A0A0U1M8P1_TALIS|nr:hypothetical protein PISL3812_09068 [Talaromyces islandicus]